MTDVQQTKAKKTFYLVEGGAPPGVQWVPCYRGMWGPRRRRKTQINEVEQFIVGVETDLRLRYQRRLSAKSGHSTEESLAESIF